jgi:hypothetical protein
VKIFFFSSLPFRSSLFVCWFVCVVVGCSDVGGRLWMCCFSWDFEFSLVLMSCHHRWVSFIVLLSVLSIHHSFETVVCVFNIQNGCSPCVFEQAFFSFC